MSLVGVDNIKAMKRYLITTDCYDPYLVDFFLSCNFSDKLNMIVYDLVESKFTIDGVNWNNIESI